MEEGSLLESESNRLIETISKQKQIELQLTEKMLNLEASYSDHFERAQDLSQVDRTNKVCIYICKLNLLYYTFMN